MNESEHNMIDYDEAYAQFSIHVPEYYNFGFDVIDEWAFFCQRDYYQCFRVDIFR